MCAFQATTESGVAQSGVAQSGVAQSGVAQSGVAQSGVAYETCELPRERLHSLRPSQLQITTLDLDVCTSCQ